MTCVKRHKTGQIGLGPAEIGKKVLSAMAPVSMQYIL